MMQLDIDVEPQSSPIDPWMFPRTGYVSPLSNQSEKGTIMKQQQRTKSTDAAAENFKRRDSKKRTVPCDELKESFTVKATLPADKSNGVHINTCSTFSDKRPILYTTQNEKLKKERKKKEPSNNPKQEKINYVPINPRQTVQNIDGKKKQNVTNIRRAIKNYSKQNEMKLVSLPKELPTQLQTMSDRVEILYTILPECKHETETKK